MFRSAAISGHSILQVLYVPIPIRYYYYWAAEHHTVCAMHRPRRRRRHRCIKEKKTVRDDDTTTMLLVLLDSLFFSHMYCPWWRWPSKRPKIMFHARSHIPKKFADRAPRQKMGPFPPRPRRQMPQIVVVQVIGRFTLAHFVYYMVHTTPYFIDHQYYMSDF